MFGSVVHTVLRRHSHPRPSDGTDLFRRPSRRRLPHKPNKDLPIREVPLFPQEVRPFSHQKSFCSHPCIPSRGNPVVTSPTGPVSHSPDPRMYLGNLEKKRLPPLGTPKWSFSPGSSNLKPVLRAPSSAPHGPSVRPPDPPPRLGPLPSTRSFPWSLLALTVVENLWSRVHRRWVHRYLITCLLVS